MRDMCVFWGSILYSYQCVCVHALFPSVHGFTLCVSIRFDMNVRLCLRLCLRLCCVCASVCGVFCFRCCGCACLCLCLLWVSVVFVYCGSCVFPVSLFVTCCACVLSGFICLNSRGYVCQRFYCTYLIAVDDLESTSTLWRRDHLSAIRLLGNLFQTTLDDGFPSNPSYSLALMSNS